MDLGLADVVPSLGDDPLIHLDVAPLFHAVLRQRGLRAETSDDRGVVAVGLTDTRDPVILEVLREWISLGPLPCVNLRATC